ncbi:hypothetical protein KCU83_g477, partial [Aureobasidium melanogenum]
MPETKASSCASADPRPVSAMMVAGVISLLRSNALIWRVASKPSMTGMEMSMSTTSGLGVVELVLPRAAALYASKASRPFVAVSLGWPCFLASNVGFDGSTSAAAFDGVALVEAVTTLFCSKPSIGESLGSDEGLFSWLLCLKDSGSGGLGVCILQSSDGRLAGKGKPGSDGLCAKPRQCIEIIVGPDDKVRSGIVTETVVPTSFLLSTMLMPRPVPSERSSSWANARNN